MIESIHFENFKALRDTTLPLGPFTLIVGPNGSGKSTALQAFRAFKQTHDLNFDDLANVEAKAEADCTVSLTATWGSPSKGAKTLVRWSRKPIEGLRHIPSSELHFGSDDINRMDNALERFRVFALDPVAIAVPIHLQRRTTLQENGAQLAGVLDRLRDDHPERFQLVNEALARWLPEFDQILFDTPFDGHRAIRLRTSTGGHEIPANQLSDGTLLALAMLTLAYVPEPPPIIGLEDPDRGIHPRLLRDVQDALYRLAYPENFGEDREPVQVIATTHSPYFVDLFSDHPEEVVVAEKLEDGARFVRLTDLPNIDDILRDAQLGEAWYTGILGGVPSGS